MEIELDNFAKQVIATLTEVLKKSEALFAPSE